jgi:hypothetical protein
MHAAVIRGGFAADGPALHLTKGVPLQRLGKQQSPSPS